MANAPVPPQNLDAEESVIGAMLVSPAAIERVIDSGIRPADFYRESHGKLFAAAVDMFTAGEPVDAITLVDALETRGILEDVGGRVRVHELAALVPATANAAHYAKIVREAAAHRGLIRAGQEITRLGFDRPGEITDLVALAEGALTRAVDRSDTHRAELATDGLDNLLDEIREAYKTGEAIMGDLTGLRDLDEKLTGLWPGQLILIAARPSVGKSTLALNVAENFAERGDVVLFSSLEMSKYELQIRMLARAARINSRVLATGQLSERDAQKLAQAIPEVKTNRSRLLINDSGSMTIPLLKAESQRLKRQEDLKLIVVDYLQLMQSDPSIQNKADQIGYLSRSLKLLARDLDIPIIALSQMNRAIELRQDKRPVLADLRDSGTLEQDADVVIFIHDPAAYDLDREADGTVELIVAKNRKGEKAENGIKVVYNREWSSFKDLGRSLAPASEAA